MAGMRKVLSERLVSPLFPAFAISWLGTNYKFVMTIFSDDTLAQKFSVIDTVLFPTWWAYAWHGLLLPLTVALLYILVYPFPARWVYEYALRRQRQLLKVRQSIDQERPLTEEDRAKLLAQQYDLRRNCQAQIRERDATIEEVNAKISALENTRMPEQRQIGGQFPFHESNPLGPSFWPPRGAVTQEEIRVLKALSNIENEQPGTNGRASAHTVLQKTGEIDMTSLRVTLGDLSAKQLIDGGDVTGFGLTNEGRRAVKEALDDKNRRPE